MFFCRGTGATHLRRSFYQSPVYPSRRIALLVLQELTPLQAPTYHIRWVLCALDIGDRP